MVVKVTSKQVAAAVAAAMSGIKVQKADGSMYDAIECFRRIAALLGVDLDENGEPMETTVTRRTVDVLGVVLDDGDGSERG